VFTLRYLDVCLVLATAPFVLAGGLPLAGYLIAAFAWLLTRLGTIFMYARARRVGDPKYRAGLQVAGMMGRIWLVALAAGPMLYLVGHLVFRLRMAGSVSGKRLSAVLAIGVCGALGTVLPALLVATLITAMLVVLIAAETVAARRRRAAHASAAHP